MDDGLPIFLYPLRINRQTYLRLVCQAVESPRWASRWWSTWESLGAGSDIRHYAL